ncbi:MAG: 3-dehydroquinate synthase [Coriobacteriia bacterium]
MSHVFLTGFMGAGKSAVGRALAAMLDRSFVDLDREIEARERTDIPSIFRERGETGFREAEHATLEGLVHRGPAVVATGGGAVLRHDNQALLKKHGVVIHLSVSPEVAMARLGDTRDRPLLAGGGIDTARRILAARLPVYAATADHVVATDGLTIDEVARAALEALESTVERTASAAMTITVTHAGGGYDIVVGAGLLCTLGDLVRRVADGPVALVTDETVGPMLGERAAGSLRDAGLAVSVHQVPAGEPSKCWEQAGALLEEFAEARLDRTATVLGLGGGVVGDLAGFCASAYMRGIGLIHVPTTLLAQVDSAIGGKTGVDLAAGKNLAGAFWPPRLVVCDTAVLATLPEAEWTNGLVELLKGAFLEGGETLACVEKGLDALVARRSDTVRVAVQAAAAFKADVVSADLRESDVRECLNLGHTLGHALELLVGYGVLPHGLAVAEGMRFAGRLAERLVGAQPGLTTRMSEALEAAGAGEEVCRRAIAPSASRLTPPQVLAAMRSDKKSRGGTVRFVLLQAPGVWTVRGVDDEVLLEELDRWSRKLAGGGG